MSEPDPTTPPAYELPPLTPPGHLDVDALGRALVLIPHPDDEVIGCGGLLARLAERSQPTLVVLVSDGSGAGELPPGTDEVRQREFRDAMAVLYPDCELRLWRLPDGALREEELVPLMEDARRSFRADSIVTPWPRDLHPDHAALGRAALRVYRAAPGLRGVLFYEAWTPLDANRLLEVTDTWARKEQALRCHATALAAQNYERSMDGLARHRALLLPGIAAGDLVRRAEAYHLVDDRHGRVGPGARFVTRPASPADAEGIIHLFRNVFGAAVDRNWWDWKYRDPDWIGTVALGDDQRLAGFYGVLPRRGKKGGQSLFLCQIVDSMVADQSRGASRRSGAFLEMCQRFLTPNVGDGKPFALAYGFPNERAMRAGEELGVYQRGESTWCWSRPARPWRRQPGPSRPWQGMIWRPRWVEPRSEQDLMWVNSLSEAMRRALPDTLLLKRDAEYWDWRFRRHPEVRYRFLQLHRLGRLVAGAVVRHREEGRALELVDAVFLDHRALHGLIRSVEDQAAKEGIDRIMIWGTDRLLADLPPGDTVREGSVAWPDEQFQASLVPQVRGHFWAMGGDTDFR
ncbi:MAG: PIG-L deacetylase family protein [Pseudomonadota bacterium]